MDRPNAAAYITGTGDDGLTHSGPCRIERVIVGTAVGTETLSIYDGTTAGGTLVAVIETDARGAYELALDLKVGLFTAVSGGTQTITVVWS